MTFVWSIVDLTSSPSSSAIPFEIWLPYSITLDLLVFLSILLIIDEATNIRFGILGPQESKGGAAWTCF
jgi:hypothetical protein